MGKGRRGMNNESGIEMTTFSETTLKRSRSGSFTGTIVDSPQGKRTGHSKFSFSQTTRAFYLDTIQSDVKGGGRRMMNQMESVAREHGANSMQVPMAAQSAHGFYEKMGFSPNPESFNRTKAALEERDGRAPDDADVKKRIPHWQKPL